MSQLLNLSNYFFNPHAIPVLTVGSLILLAGIIIFIANKKALPNFAFFLICLSVGIWLLATGIGYLCENEKVAVLWFKYDNFGVAFISISAYFFTRSFLNLKGKRIVLVGYTLALLFGILIIKTNYLVTGVRKYFWGYFPSWGILGYPFLVFFFGCMLLSFFLLFSQFPKTDSLIKKNQIKYVIVAYLIGYTGSVDYFATYGIEVYPFGYISLFLFLSIIAYTIVTYRLMDLNVAIVKTVIFTAVYSIFLGLPPLLLILHRPFFFRYFGTYWWLMPVGVAGCELLAFVAPTINHYFQERANRVLLKKQRTYQENLIRLAKEMTLTKDLRSLLVLIIRNVTREIGISHARIYLSDKKTNQYVREVHYGKERRRQSFGDSLSKNAALVQMLSRSGDKAPLLTEEVISYFEMNEPEHLEEVKAQLRSMGAAVLLPSFIGEELVAFLSLGTKRSKEIYTPDDLAMFKILAGQAGLAIENAQFYQELKESQATILQAAKLSSIGELAAGFAHQIDNPLGIISLGSQLCVREIKEDLGKENLTEKGKATARKLEDRLGKIIETAHKAADLVERIRGYAKPSDRDFEPTDLNSVMEDALALAQYQISRGAVNVTKEIPQDLPKIKGIGVQLEQVFLNLIINACEAMAGKRGELAILARVVREDGNKIEITISDNGCGISKENLRKLFDLFFTTKGPSGTGVGLSIAYRIIKDHRGEIDVESEVGEGSKFTISLPIWEEKS